MMLKQLKKTLTRLHSDDTGAMSVEKVLILAVIALPILIILYLFKTKIVGWFTTQSGKLDDSQN